MTVGDKRETLRLELREKALGSLYFFAKGVLGFDKLTNLHLEVCEFLETEEQRKLLVLPRGHYKTTLSSISYPLWLSVRNPDIRILIASATSTNAQKIMSVIRAKWERCEMLRWLFPELVPDFSKVRWNDSCAVINRKGDWPEGTYEAIGAGGTAVSRHYDFIIEDDLVNDDHLVNKEQMDKVIDWHQYKESLFISPAKGRDIVIGTRWAFFDLISHVMDTEPGRARYVRSAVEGGVPIFPEEFTLQELDRLLAVMGTYKYSCQYLNDPTQDTSRKFEEGWLKFYDTLPEGTYAFYTACDPAASVFKAGGGIARDGDYTAIITIAINPDGDIFIVDVVCDRLGVDEFIYEVFRVVETYNPTAVGIETNAFQRALLFPIRAEMKRSNTYFHITELKASKVANKQLRILSLQPYFSNGAIFVRRDFGELLHEYRLFPLAKHDDALDALAYAVQMQRSPHEPLRQVVGYPDPLSFDSIEHAINKNRTYGKRSPFRHFNHNELRLH
jgi:predicted phage terminase large subunit-like protein